MKLDFKLFSGSVSKFNKKKVADLFIKIWQKTHVALFFVILFGVAVLGGYILQQNLYGAGWSAERKQEYINTQDKNVILRENDFKKALDDIMVRKEESQKQVEPIKDIFKPY